MGYNTDFSGAFKVEPPLSNEMFEFLTGFAETRRMARDVDTIKKIDPEWEKHCFFGELGDQGAYYLVPNYKQNMGQVHDESIIDFNCPPKGQPGLWCQWIPSDAEHIEWDQTEKFYHYVEWLEYIIDHFLAPKGYTLSGTVYWRGDDFEDAGAIEVSDNHVSATGIWPVL